MTEDPRPTRPSAPGGPMSERMQALLSRAAEEQLTEQRQVSAVLAELRGLVANLGEQLRGTASSARLESLGGDVSALSTELRASTSTLGERLDGLARRVDEQATSVHELVSAQGSGGEALAVRVGGLAEDLSTQSTSLDRLTDSVEALGSFPDALAALQREVSGLHDRLAPLGDVRTGLADLVARTGAIEALRPELAAVSSRIEGLATGEQVTRSRDALLGAVAERLDRLEALADRPALTQEALDASLAPLLARLDAAASGGPVVVRLGGLDDRLSALEARLGEVAERLSDVSDAAGGVPAVATDLTRMAGRLDEVAALRADVLATREAVLAQQHDSPVPGLVLGVAALREDVEDLGTRVSEVTVPTAEAVATAVAQQVTGLVDQLAPRVADVVLTRVAATLVEQVSGSVSASVQDGLTEKVRAATADSERRISAHVDEAVLALAEALLRRRRGARAGTVALAAGDLEAGAPAAVDASAVDVAVVDVALQVLLEEPAADGLAPGQLQDASYDVGPGPGEDSPFDDQEDALAAASAAAAADVEQHEDDDRTAADVEQQQDDDRAAEDVETDVEQDDGPSGSPAQAPVTPTSALPEPVAAAPAQSVVPAPQWDDEDDEDGPSRRPWWRPGG